MFYYVSCCQTHNSPVNYVTIKSQDRKYVSQYKLHANLRILIVISLQLQVINSCKYVKMVIYHYNRDQHYKIKVVEHVYSYMQFKGRYLQFCIKCNIRNADEQKLISQMSAISVYV